MAKCITQIAYVSELTQEMIDAGWKRTQSTIKILHLTLRKQWFDMILSEEKLEEYRELKAYWVTRLLDNFSWDKDKNPIKLNNGSYCKKDYDFIKFTNGYAKDAPSFTIEYKDLLICMGRQEWGGEVHKNQFVLKLGKILSTKNINY